MEILVCSKIETRVFLSPEFDKVFVYYVSFTDLIKQTQGEKSHTEGDDVDDAGSSEVRNIGKPPAQLYQGAPTWPCSRPAGLKALDPLISTTMS